MIFRLCPEFNDKQLISKWLSEINQMSNLLNDREFNFYLAGLYLNKIGDRSQQQIILKLLNKQYLVPLISYAINIETRYHNQFDLIKVIPTAACIQVSFFVILYVDNRFLFKNNDKVLFK